MFEAISPKRRFFQEPHGVTSQKTVFFISIYSVFNDAACAPDYWYSTLFGHVPPNVINFELYALRAVGL
jgi:hypothetical protein